MNIFRVVDDGRFSSKTVAWGPADIGLFGDFSGSRTRVKSKVPRLRIVPKQTSGESSSLHAHLSRARVASRWEDVAFVALGLCGVASVFVAIFMAFR